MPVADDGEAIRHLIHMPDVVRDEDHAHPGFFGFLRIVEHLPGFAYGQGRGRLVQDQQLLAEVCRASNGDGLALTARHAQDFFVGTANLNANLTQGFNRTPVHGFFVEHLDQPPTVHRLAPQEEVPRDAHQVDECEVLVDGLDAERPRDFGRGDVDLVSLEINMSGVGRVDAGQHFDQGGFPRAVIPQQADHLSARDGEVHIAQRGDQAKAPGDIFHVDDRGIVSVASHLYLCLLILVLMITAAIMMIPSTPRNHSALMPINTVPVLSIKAIRIPRTDPITLP